MGVIRTGVSLPRQLLRELDRIVESLGVPSRSKAISEAIALYIGERAWLLEAEREYEIVGSLTLVYRHDEASEVLSEIQHKFVDLIRSTSHVHLSRELCLEVVMIVGPVSRAREFVKKVHTVRGIEALRCFVFPASGGGSVGHS